MAAAYAPGKDAADIFHAAMVWIVRPGLEDALYDIESMRRFAGVDIAADLVPDENTILHFRHLLEKHELPRKIFEKTQRYLAEKGLLRRDGTMADATINNAPSSTKNRGNTRDKILG